MTQQSIIVVLGCEVTTTGPSALLKDRLHSAFTSWLLDPDATVVVSGGQGENEPVPEAVSMAAYLTAMGMPRQKILMEGKSHSTAQNLAFSKDVLKNNGVDVGDARVLIVSNDFHIPRAKMLAKRFGYKDVDGLAVPTQGTREKARMAIREPLAWIKSLLVDWPNRAKKEGTACQKSQNAINA